MTDDGDKHWFKTSVIVIPCGATVKWDLVWPDNNYKALASRRSAHLQ